MNLRMIFAYTQAALQIEQDINVISIELLYNPKLS
jgi:hypothetical protein